MMFILFEVLHKKFNPSFGFLNFLGPKANYKEKCSPVFKFLVQLLVARKIQREIL
jgi:hypothetical protein